MRALAGGEKRTVADICQAEFVPVQFAYKILKKLERAALVRSVRGREGGYVLARSTRDFTLYDVVIAMEEEALLNDCLRQDDDCPRNTNDEPCAVHKEFQRVQDILAGELRRKAFCEVLSEPDG